MTAEVTLDLPPPPSVNRTRRVDWRSHKQLDAWTKAADALVMTQRYRANPFSRFAINVVISEGHTRLDLDNGIKNLIDYLRRIEVIEDDSWKHMRKLTVEWGHAPEGCRVTVKEI